MIQRRERMRLRNENRKIQAQLALENESKLRLKRLTTLARTLGMTVGIKWREKAGLPPSRPGTALSRMSDKIVLPGEEPPPPAPTAPMPGVPPTWEDINTTFPMNASRSIIGGTIDDRIVNQLLSSNKNTKSKNNSKVIDDDLVDESLIPKLNANASKWGLSNSTTEGTTMYTSVFEMLKFSIGGRKRNEIHKQMFVEKEIPIPVWESANAILVIATDAHDKIKAIWDKQTSIVEDEESNYEVKTAADRKYP